MKNYVKLEGHHGDVVVKRIAALPDVSKLKLVPRDKLGRAILAEGELTGHAHAIEAPISDVSVYELVDVEDMGERFVEIIREVEVKHEEHNTQTLKPGWYQIGIAREYSPEKIRRVVD